MYKIHNVGSPDDVRSSLRCSESKMSIADLEKNIELEKEGKNRKTVIQMLEATIKRKRKAGKK